MKRKIYKIFLVVVKNFLAFLAGTVAGVPAVLLLARPLLESAITKDVGLGVIALAPALLVIYAVVFGVAGGVSGVVIYNLIRIIKRKRRLLHEKSV